MVMTEDATPQKDDGNWFEQSLDQFDYELPKPGQILEGTVVRIDEDGLVIDLGLKRDALVPTRDLSNLDQELLEDVQVGKQVPVYVLHVPSGDGELIVSLSKGMESGSWVRAEKYLADGTPVEVEVVGYNRGGLVVHFENLSGFVPNSHVPDLRNLRNPQRMRQVKEELVEHTLAVKIIEVDRSKQRLVLSAVEAQSEQVSRILEELQVGQIIHGKIVNIVDFGVFVDVGGVDGLVHISELDWQRVDHPSDLFSVGEELDVKVIEINPDKQRLGLSRKALLPDPWEHAEQHYHPGDVLEGRVVKVLDFGAFIELPDGIQGLLHASEIGYSAAGMPEDVVKPGETILVRVISVDGVRKRIALSMRRVPVEQQLTWMIRDSEEVLAEEQTDEMGIAELEDSGAVQEAVDSEGEEESNKAGAASVRMAEPDAPQSASSALAQPVPRSIELADAREKSLAAAEPPVQEEEPESASAPLQSTDEPDGEQEEGSP